MTPSKIRHILSGLKSELSREKDPQRRENLAVMGLYWNSLLLFGIIPETCAVCDTCGDKMPLKNFEVINRNGKLYQLHTCKGCWNRKRYRYRKKKSESVLK